MITKERGAGMRVLRVRGCCGEVAAGVEWLEGVQLGGVALA
jgi:hypothetical protein